MSLPSSMRVTIRHIAVLAIASLALACKKASPPAPPAPPEVGVVQVSPAAVPAAYEFTAEVQPCRRIEVRARIDGIIESRSFHEGEQVTRGQVLYRLDRVRTQAAYQAAEARAENARITLARLEPLAKVQAVAQQDVDNARA